MIGISDFMIVTFGACGKSDFPAYKGMNIRDIHDRCQDLYGIDSIARTHSLIPGPSMGRAHKKADSQCVCFYRISKTKFYRCTIGTLSIFSH